MYTYDGVCLIILILYTFFKVTTSFLAATQVYLIFVGLSLRFRRDRKALAVHPILSSINLSTFPNK